MASISDHTSALDAVLLRAPKPPFHYRKSGNGGRFQHMAIAHPPHDRPTSTISPYWLPNASTKRRGLRESRPSFGNGRKYFATRKKEGRPFIWHFFRENG